jgi:hypothetical protein
VLAIDDRTAVIVDQKDVWPAGLLPRITGTEVRRLARNRVTL